MTTPAEYYGLLTRLARVEARLITTRRALGALVDRVEALEHTWPTLKEDLHELAHAPRPQK